MIQPANRTKDIAGGALMILIGVGATALGTTYQVGTLSHIGPGFFPVVLGGVLVFVGALGVALARRDPAGTETKTVHLEWRSWGLIALSILAFIGLGAYAGLLPATFAVVFLSALADRENTVRSAALLATGICAVCVVVFWWGLKMQMPLIRWGQ